MWNRAALVLAVVALLLRGGAPIAAADDKSSDWVEVRAPHFLVLSDAGEKDAHRIADQFEEIRAVFHDRFPKLQVDSGQPFIVIGAKNEGSMKLLLPDYWAKAGSIHPAGVFVSQFDTYYAVVRADISNFSENPFAVVYHEYTHALMRLNFRSLPLWLNEGLAEFFGNTVIREKDADIGRVTAWQLRAFQNAALIPIDALMKIDATSPYYREGDRASIFYPESWALVHYLMSDTDALKQNLLARFLEALNTTPDGTEAARQAFGDLNAFQVKLDRYARQSSFYFVRRAFSTVAPRDTPVRRLSASEALVLRAEFLQRTGHAKDAETLLAAAVESSPQLALAHMALGYNNLPPDREQGVAEKEFREAIRIHDADFRPHYYLATLMVRQRVSVDKIVEELERSVTLNSEFAPAHLLLSQAYRQLPDKANTALEHAIRAVQLEPGGFSNQLELGYALLMSKRFDQSRAVATQLSKDATTPQAKNAVDILLKRVADAQVAP